MSFKTFSKILNHKFLNNQHCYYKSNKTLIQNQNLLFHRHLKETQTHNHSNQEEPNNNNNFSSNKTINNKICMEELIISFNKSHTMDNSTNHNQ